MSTRRQAPPPDHDIIVVPSYGPAIPPTGMCHCPLPHRWHVSDSSTSKQETTCLRCGAHWWMEYGVEVQGPAFAPYPPTFTEDLRRSLSRFRRRPKLSPKERRMINAWSKKQEQKQGAARRAAQALRRRNDRRRLAAERILRASEPVNISIHLDGLIEIGQLTLDSEAMTCAIVALYQNAMGAPRGTKALSKQSLENTNALLVAFRPFVARLLPQMNALVNTWLRGVLWDDLVISYRPVEEVVAALEGTSPARRLRLFALPGIEQIFERVKRGSDTPLRRRLQRVLGSVAAGRPGRRVGTSQPIQEREDVKLVHRFDQLVSQFRADFNWVQRQRESSDETEIASELLRRGHPRNYCAAIAGARTINSAVRKILAVESHRKENSIRTGIVRGRRLLSSTP